MRNTFAKALTKKAAHNSNLFLLYGDIGNKLFDDFKQLRPKNFVNAGVAEANMVGVAAGLAKSGFLPIVYTINSFLSLKTIEQIKIDICYQNLPVILVGTGSALSYSNLGTTHHSLEDFALLSAIPNLNVLAPADSSELEHSFDYALTSKSPCYIRIGKKGEKNFTNYTSADSKLGIKKIFTSETSKVLLLSTGSIAGEVFSASMQLRSENIPVNFWTLPLIKPISDSTLAEILSPGHDVIIIEEHTSYGGLSSILAYANQFTHRTDSKLFTVNTGDKFHNASGNLSEIREKLGLDSIGIVNVVKSILCT